MSGYSFKPFVSKFIIAWSGSSTGFENDSLEELLHWNHIVELSVHIEHWVIFDLLLNFNGIKITMPVVLFDNITSLFLLF